MCRCFSKEHPVCETRIILWWKHQVYHRKMKVTDHEDEVKETGMETNAERKSQSEYGVAVFHPFRWFIRSYILFNWIGAWLKCSASFKASLTEDEKKFFFSFCKAIISCS